MNNGIFIQLDPKGAFNKDRTFKVYLSYSTLKSII